MHVASRRQLSVVDVNLFEASAPPTKVKHAVSALMLPFKAEISYVRANDASQPNQRYKLYVPIECINACYACRDVRVSQIFAYY